MLGQHPELYGVPELNLFLAETIEQLLQQLKNNQLRMRHGLVRTVAQLYAGEQTLSSISMAHRWLLNRLHCSTGEVYVELSSKVQPLRILDKSPAYCLNTKSLNRIRQTFPGAHYLHLIRHPRPQGESFMKLILKIHHQQQKYKQKLSLPKMKRSLSPTLVDCLDRSMGLPIIDPQNLWYRMHWRILDFLSTVPAEQQMRLRGEDLLDDPRRHFEKICHWLGLSWNESAFEAMLHPEDSPYACFGPYGAQFGNDPNFLNSPTYRQRAIVPSKLEGPLPWRRDAGGFIPPVVKLAQELGYE
jgi:hypothetical protein